MPRELPLDILNDYSREVVFRRQNSSMFEKLAKQTHFSCREVEALAVIHRKIVETRGPMTRSVFRDMFHSGLDFTKNIRHLLIDRIFSVFDRKNTLQLDYDSWIRGLSIVLRGTLDERIHFAYAVYDLLKTNKLRKEEFFPMLRGCIIKLPEDEGTEEAVKDLIDLLLKKIDMDRDGVVSEEDFKEAVKRNPLYLQCLGPVFPSRSAIYAFLATFTNTSNKY